MFDVGCLMLVVSKVQCTKYEVPRTPDVGNKSKVKRKKSKSFLAEHGVDVGAGIWDMRCGI